MNRQIDRIEAERDLKQIQLLAAAGSADGYNKLVEQMNNTVGKIVVYEPSIKRLNLDDDSPDPEFDRAAFEALKAKVRASR